MKQLLTVLVFIFSLTFTCVSQEEVKVYETKNGVQNVLPSKKVVTDGNTTKVYSYQNGVRKVLPDKVYEKRTYNNTTTIKEYQVRNSGVREIQPTRVIKKTNNNNKKSSSSNWW